MILGLDVGGTQTDAVLLKDGQVWASCKTVNRPDLLETLRLALDKVLDGVDPNKVRRMVFSTTMATNSIVQDTLDPAGMIVTAGPGMDPSWFSVGPSYHVLEGSMDHRGQEVKPVEKSAVLAAAGAMKKAGIALCGVTGKFSVRNSLHEDQIEKWVGKEFTHLALGHRFSGSLNFPRRIVTTYLNAALFNVHRRFITTLSASLTERGLGDAPWYLMKPDGGTVSLKKSDVFPAQTAQSGPAASVMGALALDTCPGTSLVLDIGGTTTDMALVLDGAPLLVPRGITLGPYATNIRSLLTRSIGAGGDSEVRVGPDGEITIGPLRRGSPMAFGGPAPTPTDALVVTGALKMGDAAKAGEAMGKIAAAAGCQPREAAERTLKKMARSIADEAGAFLDHINSRPVYTIHEVIEGLTVAPEGLVVLGGPAPYLSGYLAEAFGLPCRVPANHEVANAVGAAAARITAEITLQADTQRGTVVIPEAGMESPIQRDFNMDAAEQMARKVLADRAIGEGARIEDLRFSVTEKEEFAMIRGGMRTGRNLRLKLSIVPGLIPQWKGGENVC